MISKLKSVMIINIVLRTHVSLLMIYGVTYFIFFMQILHFHSLG